VAVATPAIAAAQAATRTIPIVMSPATAPVGSGFVKSLAHPAGNITGMANMFVDLTAKSVELLRTLLPHARKIAVLMSSNPTHPSIYEEVRATAGKAVTTPIMARTADDLQRAFKDIAAAESDAVFVLADPLRPAIVSYAASARIPALYQYSEWVNLGDLVSYGPSLPALFRRSALYIDKIFRGSDPANLPVEQPTTFELVLNLKTASSLGLSIPDSILSRADRTFE
jgi:putative ABC transport system substrate-binding protein